MLPFGSGVKVNNCGYQSSIYSVFSTMAAKPSGKFKFLPNLSAAFPLPCIAPERGELLPWQFERLFISIPFLPERVPTSFISIPFLPRQAGRLFFSMPLLPQPSEVMPQTLPRLPQAPPPPLHRFPMPSHLFLGKAQRPKRGFFS
jgi:hypothetical protein